MLPNISFSRSACRLHRNLSCAQHARFNSHTSDPRIDELGRDIQDDFAKIRKNYKTPRNPLVLAHGLFGFESLNLTGKLLPGIQYWRGIIQALRSNGIEVYTTSVPPSASIKERALRLQEAIQQKAADKPLNIIAHSMGGLDARYMLSTLQPSGIIVKSLTTIATPHRGSSFADYLIDGIGPKRLPSVYKSLQRLRIETDAFEQLTTRYMTNEFNPANPDAETTQYFSYGASTKPAIWSAFRFPHRVIYQVEGQNDGLVSVDSSKWGSYRGTLVNVSHLDLINWTNRFRWLAWELAGNKRQFNAIAFYLDIADMLARQGL